MTAGGRNEVRIIGGRLKGRKLRFEPVEGLRPTLERLRAVAFNWLTLDIDGARCLDLCAGTGAFGFEALSRGAAGVVMVEYHPRVVAALGTAARGLAVDPVLLRRDLLAFLREPGPHVGFDIVFLDPPWAWPRVDEAVAALAEGPVLRPGGLAVVEHPRRRALTGLAPFEVLRTALAGDAALELLRRPLAPPGD